MGFADKFANKGGANKISQLVEKHEQKATDNITSKASQAPQPHAQNNSPVDNTKASKADLIYLVKGVDDGRNAWYYVLVERLKLSLFLKALNDDIIHLENYGVILYSAYGDEPPQEITDKLKKEYDIK